MNMDLHVGNVLMAIYYKIFCFTPHPGAGYNMHAGFNVES